MRRILLALTLLALPMMAQEQSKPADKPAQEKNVQKLVVVKYADAQAVADLLHVFPVRIQVNREMRVIGLDGTEAAVVTATQAIKDLDVPPAPQKNIELTVYYLNGTNSEDTSGDPFPPELAGVVTQLKGTFSFKQYRLMDVLRIRTRPGQQAQTSGMTGSMDVAGGQQLVFTQFRIHSASVSPDGGTVHIDGLTSSSRIPVGTGIFQAGTVPAPQMVNPQFSYQDVSLNADLDVKEGQKAVVGRVGLDRNKALFLVLTAQVVQ